MKRSTIIEMSIPAVVFVLIALLTIAGVGPNIEKKGYDALLHLRPPIKEDPSIRIIQIDDEAITLGGTFPWSRLITAKGLLMLKELGAQYVSLDIEFLEKSQLGVNADAIKNELPTTIGSNISDYIATASDFITSITNGTIRVSEARDYLPDFKSAGEDFAKTTIDSIKDLVQDNDILLSNAYKIFGQVGSAFHWSNSIDKTSFENDLLLAKNYQFKTDQEVPFKTKALVSPISILSSAALTNGFSNVTPDADGVRRRVALAAQVGNEKYLSLIFAPLLKKLGNPSVHFEGNLFVIELSKIDPARSDIRIPLDANGQMLINYTQNLFANSFGNFTFARLISLENLETEIYEDAQKLNAFKVFEQYRGAVGIVEKWANYLKNRTVALKTGKVEAFEEALKNKAEFMKSLPAFILYKNEYLDFRKSLVKSNLDEATINNINADTETISQIFDTLASRLATYTKLYDETKKMAAGSFCVIGLTGTSTTDIGITPFESQYMNVGIHANIANTIIQQNFLQESPPIVGLFLSLIILGGGFFFGRRLLPLQSALVSFAILVGFVVIVSLFFVITGIYLGVLIPGLAMLVSSIAMTLLKFRTSDKEKGFIRDAFSRYLSDDVIKQIVSDPKSLNLGGAKKELTAIFTDVKGFSTISEKLDPSDLVKLLNEYLTAMSDIVLDSEGFIDKYEGDAIIGFWGAPVFHEDHARRACISALRMKAVEIELNKRVIEEGLSPTPLLTRIGINTGEMVVGNMGTNRRLNYTIMGNAVNLAARLEGVNKKYGTWILISETTRNEAGDDILYRRLDRVRVVGINTPVRLYEVVAEKASVDPQTVERIEGFEKGLTIFEEKKWDESRAVFEDILKKYPDDEPSKLYLGRAKENLETPPPTAWDGVYNLTEK